MSASVTQIPRATPPRAASMLPQKVPSLARALVQACALIVVATVLFGALWARADTSAQNIPTAR